MVKPFEKQADNYINMLNELIIVLSFLSIFIISNYELPESAIEIWGWALIAPIVFSLVATWIVTLPGAFSQLRENLSQLFAKENLEAAKERKTKSLEAQMRSQTEMQKPREASLDEKKVQI